MNYNFFHLIQKYEITTFNYHVYILICSLCIFGCAKEKITISKNDSDIQRQHANDPPVCNCTQYMTFSNGIPEYNTIEDFKSALDCLKDCVDKHNDYLSNKYQLLNEDEYDDLFYYGNESEFQPLEDFNSSWTVMSLFKKDDIAELSWLNSGGINLDWDSYPNEIVPFDEAFKALLNFNCIAKIDNVVVDFCEGLNDFRESSDSRNTPHLCSTWFFLSDDYPYANNTRMIRLRGTAAHFLSLTAQFIQAQIKNYRVRNNGNWRRTRASLSISGSSWVRDAGCNAYTNLQNNPVPIPVRERNSRSSLSTEAWGWVSGPWFHHPEGHAGPADGAVVGSNGAFTAIHLW